LDLKLLDEYQGNSIPDNQTSLCIQLIFQSNQQTLLTKDVDKIIQDLEVVLKQKHGIIIRM